MIARNYVYVFLHFNCYIPISPIVNCRGSGYFDNMEDYACAVSVIFSGNYRY